MFKNKHTQSVLGIVQHDDQQQMSDECVLNKHISKENVIQNGDNILFVTQCRQSVQLHILTSKFSVKLIKKNGLIKFDFFQKSIHK
jgi:hypothetical protein